MNVLFQVVDHPNRFGYADDVAVTSVGNIPREAIAAAQSNVDKLVELALEHKIDSNPAKIDLVVFGGRLKKKIDLTSLSITVRGQRIESSSNI